MKMKILQLGCGMNKVDNAITLDINPDVNPDVVHNLDIFPYPFPDNEFDLIICKDIVEHLDNIIRVMEEIHRICKHGGEVRIETPHFSSDDSFADITHRHQFSIRSFNIFTNENNKFPFYTKARYKILYSKIIFGGLYRSLGVEWFANKFPLFYESHLAFLFQAHKLIFELKVL